MSDVRTPWQQAQSHMRARAGALSEKDNPYAAFAAIRREVREIVEPPALPTDDFNGVTVITEDNSGRQYRKMAFTIYLSEQYDEKTATMVRDIVDAHADDKNLKVATVIQQVADPVRQEDGLWKLDMVIKSELSYDQAKTQYRAICTEAGKQPNGALYADEGEAVIDWVARHVIQTRLEKVLAEHGLNDFVTDHEALAEADQRMLTHVEHRSGTGSSMDFIV
jgi:hypothetical protein